MALSFINTALKNLLIHFLIIIFYFQAKKEIVLLPKEQLDTLLLFVGLIVIAPITSNFIYTYGNMKSKYGLFFGHITTFCSMLVIGFLFIILDILVIEMVGNILSFRISIIIFWIAVISFDFADTFSVDEHKKERLIS